LLTGEQLGDGGLAANATLNGPRSVKVDRSGNLYIADTDNHRVRFNSAETGIISTFAGSNTWGCSQGAGPIGGALFASPFRLELKPDGSVYVLDSNCGQLYKLTPYLGGIDSLDCQTLAGWATDASRAGQAIPVNIYSDGSLLATVTADQPAAVNGLHGFSWALPDSLFDSVTHTIRVTYDGTGIDLPGSPTYSTCDPLPVEGQAKRRNR
jgi:hypothetical protein